MVQKSMSAWNRTLIILTFILNFSPIPLQDKHRIFAETPPFHPVLFTQHEPTSIGHPSLPVRLEQAGMAITEDDSFFQETIALEHALESETSPEVTKKDEIVQLLQDAAYQASSLATELHLLRTKLHEDVFPVLRALQPTLLGDLDQALVLYEKSKIALEKTVGQVLQEIPTRKAGSLGKVLALYLENNQVCLEDLQALQAVLSKIKKRGTSVVGSVYEFLDSEIGEDADYGLFTYIVFNGKHSRNSKFLERVLASTNRASEAFQAKIKQGLHIFYLPVKNRLSAEFSLPGDGDDDQFIDQAPLAKRLMASNYDPGFATDLFVRFCQSATQVNNSDCRLSGQGPYLLTMAQPLSHTNSIRQPSLLLDFSHVEEEAFGEFIQAFKDQALGPEFPDARKVETMRLRILQVIVKAANFIEPTGKGIKGILEFFHS